MMFYATNLTAQQSRVPADVQYTLLTKIMTFDRKFAAHAGAEVAIGIVYQRHVAESRTAADELAQAIGRSHIKAINGLRVHVVMVDVESTAALQSALHDDPVDIAYIMPLKGDDVADIIGVVQRVRARSFTGVPEYVALGVCAGIGIKRSLPEIIINLAAAKAAGQDFSAQLLKLSRVV